MATAQRLIRVGRATTSLAAVAMSGAFIPPPFRSRERHVAPRLDARMAQDFQD